MLWHEFQVFPERQGKWKATTQSREFLKSIKRYYSNAYTDGEKQDAINLYSSLLILFICFYRVRLPLVTKSYLLGNIPTIYIKPTKVKALIPCFMCCLISFARGFNKWGNRKVVRFGFITPKNQGFGIILNYWFNPKA